MPQYAPLPTKVVLLSAACGFVIQDPLSLAPLVQTPNGGRRFWLML